MMNKKQIEQFVTILRMQRYADRSVKTYTSILSYFLRLSANYKPEDITNQQIEDFIICMIEKKENWTILSESDDCYNHKILKRNISTSS